MTSWIYERWPGGFIKRSVGALLAIYNGTFGNKKLSKWIFVLKNYVWQVFMNREKSFVHAIYPQNFPSTP